MNIRNTSSGANTEVVIPSSLNTGGIPPTRATARVSTPRQPYPRPYNDYGGNSALSLIATLILVSVFYSPTRSTGHKRKGVLLLSVLGGLMLLLQLLVPSLAFASSTSTSTKRLPALSSQGVLDLAGVSVVRLVILYTQSKTQSHVECTALGTLIASWPATSATAQNNWVLTDSSLLDPNGGSCAPGDKLFAIELYASSEFTNHTSALTVLDQLNCQTGVCIDQVIGNNGSAETITKSVNGGVLLSFHTDASHTLPYLAVAPSTSVSPTGIELANAAGMWPAAPKVASTTSNLQDFLEPKLGNTAAGNSPGSTPISNEPGMPFIDSNGQVTGMQLPGVGNLLQLADIQSLEQQQSELNSAILPTHLAHNPLNKQWDTGITQYEQKDYTHAVQTLSSIENANPSFQAPKAFVQMANALLHPGTTGTPTTSATPGTGQGSSGFLGIPNWLLLLVGLFAGVIALILLFVLVSLTFGRARVLYKPSQVQGNTSTGKISLASLLAVFRDELERINRLLNRRTQPPVVIQQTSLVKERQPLINPQPVPTAPNIPCPNCGQSVRAGATFCPNCRFVLSSGTSIARPVAQRLPVTEPPAPVKVATPPNRVEPQPVQVKQDDLAMNATLQRLWDRAEN